MPRRRIRSSDIVRINPQTNQYRNGSRLQRALTIAQNMSSANGGAGVSATLLLDSLLDVFSNEGHTSFQSRNAALVGMWRLHRDGYLYTEERFGGRVIRGTRATDSVAATDISPSVTAPQQQAPTPSSRYRANARHYLVPNQSYNPYRYGSRLYRAYDRLANLYRNERNSAVTPDSFRGVSVTQFLDNIIGDRVFATRNQALMALWNFHNNNRVHTVDSAGILIRGNSRVVSDRRPPLRRSILASSAATYAPQVDESIDSIGSTYGIEIEVCMPSGMSIGTLTAKLKEMTDLDFRFESYNHSTRTWWKVTTDASISSNGAEIVSPILTTGNAEQMEQVERICDALDAIDCSVDRSCGLHVHVKAANNLAFFKRLTKNYVASEQAIDALMPIGRRNGNSYCLSVADWNVERIDSATSVRQMIERTAGTSRFYKINYQAFWRQGTVEFRQHGGTTNPRKVKYWVEFVVAFVNLAKSDIALENVSFDSLFGALDLSAPCKQFLNTRRIGLARRVSA